MSHEVSGKEVDGRLVYQAAAVHIPEDTVITTQNQLAIVYL